jgi:hypothetical protein
VIEHREVGLRLALTMLAQTLVDSRQVIQHDVRFGEIAQEAQHLDQTLTRNPESRDLIQRGLHSADLGSELRQQLAYNSGL